MKLFLSGVVITLLLYSGVYGQFRESDLDAAILYDYYEDQMLDEMLDDNYGFIDHLYNLTESQNEEPIIINYYDVNIMQCSPSTDYYREDYPVERQLLHRVWTRDSDRQFELRGCRGLEDLRRRIYDFNQLP